MYFSICANVLSRFRKYKTEIIVYINVLIIIKKGNDHIIWKTESSEV